MNVAKFTHRHDVAQKIIRLPGWGRKILASLMVQIIYGKGVPADATFSDPLVRFAEHLNFGEEAKEVIGVIWAEALTRLDATQVETVLVKLPSVTQYFGLMLESLPHLVSRQDLSAKTVMRVSLVIAKHIEDQFGPGIDRATIGGPTSAGAILVAEKWNLVRNVADATKAPKTATSQPRRNQRHLG
jgi:hypothetical protein